MTGAASACWEARSGRRSRPWPLPAESDQGPASEAGARGWGNRTRSRRAPASYPLSISSAASGRRSGNRVERGGSIRRQREEWTFRPAPGCQPVIPDPDPNGIQLHLLEKLTTLLKQAGSAHWLLGRRAVDFRVGAITRAHEDIDLVIWRDDAPAVRELLAPHGYVEAPPPPEESALHTHFSRQ